MKAMILFVMVTFFLVVPGAHAASCYGKKEIALAKHLVANKAIRAAFMAHGKEAKFVRSETCDTIAMTGSLGEIDYAEGFMENPALKQVMEASGKQHLDPLQVQAAMVDLLRL